MAKIKESDLVTKEQYLQRYADKHCNGDIEEAKEHLIVQINLQAIEDRDAGRKVQ